MVRGNIIKNGKVAIMHSLKYDYYKLSGGEIEEGESVEETLVREVLEESGLVVREDSIKEIFVLEYVPSEYAISVNVNGDHKEKERVEVFKGILERESRVLQIISEEVL